MKRTFLILSLLLGILSSTFAQENEITLTIEEAKSYALSHNRTLQNASLDAQIAEANRWQTVSTMLPQLSASYDYANMCGYEMVIMNMPMAMPPYGTFGLSASVAITGAQIVGAQMQKIAIDMANISLKKTERTITSNITKMYMSILAMEATVKLLNTSLENMEKLHQMTEKSVKIGVVEQIDADKLLVQVASLRSSIHATKRSLELLYNSMVLQLGADVNTKLVLTDNIENIISPNEAMSLLNSQFELDSNYNYQLLEKNLELAKKQVRSSEVAFAPTVAGYYQYSNKNYYSDEQTMDMTPPNTIGVSVSLPLWTNWQRMSNIKEAKISYKKTQNTFNDTKAGLLVQEKQLRYNVTSAYENYEIQTNNLDVTKRVFDNITIKYGQGAASSLEVTNASTNLVSAQTMYISAMLDLINAKVELEDLLNK